MAGKRRTPQSPELTPEYIRRWKRIKSNPIGEELFYELMRLSEQIPGAQLAADILGHVAAIRRAQVPGERKPPRKHAGPHDPGGDSFLLACYDAGIMPGQTEKWSRTALAHQLAKSGRWGTASQIDEHLRKLINRRNKQKRAKV
jgi:hypothetical protein